MSVRFCPNCKIELGSYDSYFCSVCANPLPADLIINTSSAKFLVYPQNETAHKRRFNFNFHIKLNSKIVVLMFFLVLVVGVFLAYRPFTRKFFLRNNLREDTADLNLNQVDFDLGLGSNIFGADRVAEFVPADASLYIEVQDLGGFVKTFVDETDIKKEFIENGINLLSDHFAVFSTAVDGKTEWAFVFIPKDLAKAEKFIKDNKDSYWKTKIVEGRLIMSTSDILFKLVSDSKNKISLSLALNSQYVKEKNNLPKDGQILILFLKPDSREVLRRAEGTGIKPDLVNVMENVIKMGFKGLVVKEK